MCLSKEIEQITCITDFPWPDKSQWDDSDTCNIDFSRLFCCIMWKAVKILLLQCCMERFCELK